MVLFYCETCGVRVAPEDLDDGTARRIDESRALCSACVSQERGSSGKTESANHADLHITFEDDAAEHDARVPSAGPAATPNQPSAPADSRKSQRLTRGTPVPMAKPASGEFSRKSTQQLPVARGSSRAQSAQPPAAAAPNKWMAFAAGAGIVLIGVAVALLRSPSEGDVAAGEKGGAEVQTKSAEKPPVATPTPTPAVVTAPAPELPKDPREREAFLLLEEAKVYKRTNLDDVYGYADKLEQLFNAYRATSAGQEAQKLLAAVQYPDPQSQLAPDSAWSGAVNLQALIDTKKDVVGGKWKKEGTTLSVEPEKTTRIQLPYEPPEEYDFKIVFKRMSGEEDVNLMLTSRGKALMWSMGAGKNTVLGFECIQGKDASNAVATVRSSKALETNRTYTCVVQVRKRVVRAFLDGKIVKEYRTDYSEFSMRNDWKLKSDRVLGLGAHNSKVVFEKIELRAVTGTGKKIR